MLHKVVIFLVGHSLEQADQCKRVLLDSFTHLSELLVQGVNVRVAIFCLGTFPVLIITLLKVVFVCGVLATRALLLGDD